MRMPDRWCGGMLAAAVLGALAAGALHVLQHNVPVRAQEAGGDQPKRWVIAQWDSPSRGPRDGVRRITVRAVDIAVACLYVAESTGDEFGQDPQPQLAIWGVVKGSHGAGEVRQCQ